MALSRKISATPMLMCVPLALLAAVALRAVILMPVASAELDFQLIQAGGMGALADTLLDGSPYSLLLAAPGLVRALAATALACGAIWIVAAIVGMLVRGRWALRLVRGGWIAVFAASAVLAVTAFDAGSRIAAAHAEYNPEAGDVAYGTFLLRWYWVRWSFLASAVAAGMLVLGSRGKTVALYVAGEDPGQGIGDRVIENIRSGGSDIRFRRSWLSSTLLHWIVIVAVPFLLTLRGCVSPYLVPYGRGEARVVHVMRVIKRAKKPRKKYILRKNAAVYWDIPDLNESKVAQEVDEQTQLTHVADRNAVHGKMGAGGGKKGGWPDGVPGGKIRFIRLEYAGRDWDDGMDAASAADINFLNFLRKEVPFPVAHKSESNPISMLARYPKGRAPPFVYMTGSDTIRTSAHDRKVLREYMLGGGMLFADAGSRRWDYHFRDFIGKVLPGKRLIDIADDDVIYQMPYTFPNGAPPLWHHGGERALGMRHKGRWIVFYYPGDMNDAWKTGRWGLDRDLADKAYQMGVNVMYYAITRYLEQTRKRSE